VTGGRDEEEEEEEEKASVLFCVFRLGAWMEPRTRCRAQLFLCENVKILRRKSEAFWFWVFGFACFERGRFRETRPYKLYARFLEPISDGSSWTVVRFVVHSHRWFNFSDIYTFGGLDARVEDRVFFLSKLRVSAVKRGAADGRPARRRASLARAVGSPRPTLATQSEARESPLGAPPTPLSASSSDGSAREGRRRQIGSADLRRRRRRRRRG
jgi:hypothetical protein